jgi:hypothetical protein
MGDEQASIWNGDEAPNPSLQEARSGDRGEGDEEVGKGLTDFHLRDIIWTVGEGQTRRSASDITLKGGLGMRSRLAMVGISILALGIALSGCGRGGGGGTGSVVGKVQLQDQMGLPNPDHSGVQIKFLDASGNPVMVEGQELVASSTDTGDFSVGDVPPGTYTLVFTKEDYNEQRVSDVAVTAGQTTKLDKPVTLIPIPMEDLAKKAKIEVSSEEEGFPKSNANDGNPVTAWKNKKGDLPATLVVDWGTPKKIKQILFSVPVDLAKIGELSVEFWDSAAGNWSPVYVVSGPPNPLKDVQISEGGNTFAFRIDPVETSKVRINCKLGNDEGYIAISEIQVK